MSWRPVESRELGGLTEFLLSQEEWAVNASALLFQGTGKSHWPSTRFAKFWRHPGPGTAFGAVIAFRSQTTYIPVLPDRGFLEPFTVSGPKGRHFSLLGPTEWVRWITDGTTQPAYKDLNYLLMCGPQNLESGKKLPPGWEIHKAGAGDRDLLFPLQAAYEKEEVVFAPEEFEPWACYHNLKGLLQREQVWYVQDDRFIPRAKAGTNAQGLRWCQLGGIYTDPGYRRKGLGEILLAALVNKLSFRGFRTSLFVKDQNLAALALYEKVGFRTLSGFRISYHVHG